MTIIEKIEREQMRLDIPAFKPGDAVKVHFRIVEGEKERIQVFQGNVIRMHRGTVGATVTVRKVSDGVGVERIFPLHSPFIDHIELVTEGSVRRSRLYYLRDLKGKATSSPSGKRGVFPRSEAFPARRRAFWKKGSFLQRSLFPFLVFCYGECMAGRKKSVSVQEELLLCPSAKPGDWFPGIPVSAVAGIDEAGRGCLAGPVVAAAVILPEGAVIPGLADSKVLSPTRRDGLAAEIGAVALAWGLGVVWPPEIDRINILQATLKAMCHAASVLKVRPKGLLIDGNQTIPEPLFRQRAACWPSSPRQKSIVDGDALVPVISAASIIAKTFRDMLMDKLDHRYPGYGFAKHKGYGSKEHFAALRELGPCPMHRKTFRGVLPERQTARQGSLL